MKSKRFILPLICIILVLVTVSCTQETKPTITNNNVSENNTDKQQTKDQSIKVNYKQEIATFQEEINLTLEELGLKEVKELISVKQKEQKKVNEYKFFWNYNYRQLEVPLFGAKGRLLSDYKEEIINKFKTRFPIVKTQWQKNEKQILTIKISFSPQTDLSLLTHKLQFVQEPPVAKMAVVIDDLGFNHKGTEEMLKIKRPLTLAVLPGRPFSQHDAKLVKEADQELILHQPLEPLNPKVDPGAGAIDTSMTKEEIRTTLQDNLNSLPQVMGINNHMGSKGTSNKRVMKEIVKVLKDREIFYVDSSTSADSVAFEVARANNLPTVANYLFIDNIDKKKEIKKMLLRLGKIALKKKELVVIGHVRQNTALALQEVIPKLEDWGIKLVYASQLVK
ncbi:hypothetical protein JCM16358_19800 [Halanaerocella petrolearia]